MASSTNKKVQVYRFDREPLQGFVNPATFVSQAGVELLHLNGTVSVLALAEIKTVLFVRDFSPVGIAVDKRAFVSRPKADGLWLRLTFRDGDTLEGTMPNDLLKLDALGYHLIPPDGTRRVFVPRTALTEVQVLGVVGSPIRSRRKAPARDQIELFDGS